jgi:mono/diheme cytochrome c family protein
MIRALRRNRGIWAALIAALAVCGAAAFWLLSAPRPAFSDSDGRLEEAGNAERGRLVFAAGDCASCHASPGQPDRLRLGGGLALASPFGTLRAPNISMDREDGIGSWRAVDLGNALLSGVSPQRAHYYPALPYTSYVRMDIADVRDLWAFMKTLPAVQGRAPPHELPLIFRFRRVLGFWKLLYFDRTPLPDAPGRDAMWLRGRYLVESVGHCAECHSSRDLFGGLRDKTRLAGGPDPEGTGFAPNITPARLGDWSEDDIVELLSSGRTRAGNRIGSTMVEVVKNTAMLPQEDRRAMAVYLKSLPPRPTPHP